MNFDFTIEELQVSLPGINVEDALMMMANKQKIYISFLINFYTKYTEQLPIIKKYFAENNLVELQKILHNIKSLAGNIGDENLRKLAIDLEKATKLQDLTEYNRLKEPFLTAFLHLLDILQNFKEKYS